MTRYTNPVGFLGLLCSSPTPLQTQLAAPLFAEVYGLSTSDFVATSPLVSIGIPYVVLQEGETRRDMLNRLGVDAAALGHPLYWLPERFLSPDVIDGPDSGVLVETLDEWALRVALAIDNAVIDLYDPYTGNWASALDHLDIDPDTLDGSTRITAWLRGGNDPELDEFTLDAALSLDVPEAYADALGGEQSDDWAADLARIASPSHLEAGLGASASELIIACDDLLSSLGVPSQDTSLAPCFEKLFMLIDALDGAFGRRDQSLHMRLADARAGLENGGISLETVAATAVALFEPLQALIAAYPQDVDSQLSGVPEDSPIKTLTDMMGLWDQVAAIAVPAEPSADDVRASFADFLLLFDAYCAAAHIDVEHVHEIRGIAAVLTERTDTNVDVETFASTLVGIQQCASGEFRAFRDMYIASFGVGLDDMLDVA